MFSKVFLCCFFAFAASQVVVHNPPQPYSFGYDNTDEFGTRMTRQETGDEFNNKVGSYSYVDALGVARTVNYVADAAGFRVNVDTNEPGTKTSSPAHAQFLSSAVEGPHPVLVKAVHAAPVAVHAAPVAVRAVHGAPVVHAAPFAYARHAAPLAYNFGSARLV
ncbi:cuticle protein, putative [Ixodes scapularis]|uniref:Cuticle protein, putative n=1 Tax=Ixodes scapularis TaxID=6945 RepID=B7PZU2_IXOSC|nr:cuticle protein, putative [Ixodes scapularis]|eukprot:XP_002406109.1 cuticle protein, putative [Ixodes scapularis]